MPAAFYDFFRKIKFLPNDVTIEADSTTDTAQIQAGVNIAFDVEDSTTPGTTTSTDRVIINGPEYDVYVPINGAPPGDGAVLRLERSPLGTESVIRTDIDFIADPASPILISRTGTNSITISASSPTIPFSQEQIEDFSAGLLQNGNHTEITVNYDDLGPGWPSSQDQDSTNGSGINALFDISIVNNQYYAVITAPGSGYAVGDTVTIFGINFTGGTSPLNDVVITVSSIDGSGGILAYSSITGTPPPKPNIDLAVTSTLQTITNRGATTTNAINITNATGSANTASGALKVTGGVGVGENLNVGGAITTQTGVVTGYQLVSLLPDFGTAPLLVSSTAEVENLHSETASRWHTARTFSLAGDLSGSVSIDGSGDITLTATVGSDSVALGADTTGNYVATVTVTGNGLSGNANSESADLIITSNATATSTPDTIVFRDANQNFSANIITAALNGNATTATTLQTARTINTVSFDGSANIVVEPFVEQDLVTNATRYLTFVDSSTAGHQRLNLDTDITYNPSTGTLTSTAFSGTLSGAVNATTVTASDTVTLNAGAIEEVSVDVGGAAGAISLDVKNNSVYFYSGNATANWTINFRGDASTTLNSYLATGKSATVVLLANQGVTPFYPTAYTVDGVSVTPRWLGGAAPTAGNASGTDVYSFTIIKTAASTYTIIASQARYA